MVIGDHFADGMSRIARPDGKLLVLAADQRGSLRRMLAERGRPDDDEALLAMKRDIVRTLSPLASGLLLDPEIGLPALAEEGAIPSATGVLVALERTDPPWRGGLRRSELLDGMTPARVREIGGDVAKLLAYLRPDHEPAGGHAANLIERAATACDSAGVPLVVEVVVYPLPDEDSGAYQRSFPSLVRDAALVAEEAGTRLLKLQYPGSARGCRLVGEAIGLPWALLSGGAPAATFLTQLAEALDAGACGCMAGRSVWSGGVALDRADRAAYLGKEGRRVLTTLASVVDRHGRAWDG